MNKLIAFVATSCIVLSGCSSKPKLEAPECPTSEKGAKPVNEEGLSPIVSDDGKFTYLKFGKGQEVPSFTSLRIDGKERVIDYTFNPDTLTATVFGIYPTIVLRAGGRVACIRNTAYDPRSPQSRDIITDGTVGSETIW
jgi:hypothetical protein